MKLFFAPGTRAVRSAWLMYELGVTFELHRFDHLADPALRAPEFLQISPNGRIPVLQDGDVILQESAAIAQYLGARYGDGSLMPGPDAPNFATFLQWLHYGEGMIMGPMNNYVVETVILKPERRSQDHANRALKLMGRMLGTVDVHMEGREYLAGAFTIADTITGHACYMARKFGVDVSETPHLSAYIDRLEARVAFQKALAL